MTLSSLVSISEAAKMLGVTPRAIRFYEQCGMIVCEREGRSKNSGRLLSKNTCDRIAFILQMRNFGFSLSDIDLMMRAQPSGGELSLTPGQGRVQLAYLIRKRAEIETAITELENLVWQKTGQKGSKTAQDHYDPGRSAGNGAH